MIIMFFEQITYGELEKVYLIALLDDHSRFIVSAEYFKDQKGFKNPT